MTTPPAMDRQPSRKIVFHAIQLQSMPEQIAALHASWSVLDANGNTLTRRTVAFSIPVTIRDSGALVAAQHMLVERLARIVTDTLEGL